MATDIAARGLDVMDITHIVNYDVPMEAAGYVHRIGRTARMGKTGYAITFVTPEDGKCLTEIEKLINREVPQFDPPWLVHSGQAPMKITKPREDVDTEPKAATRLKEAQRDELLDELGFRPVKRTLGSRFRSARKFRR